MGLRERSAWLIWIESRDVPEEIKQRMRQQVKAFDQLVAGVLAAIERTYHRERSRCSPSGDPPDPDHREGVS